MHHIPDNPLHLSSAGLCIVILWLFCFPTPANADRVTASSCDLSKKYTVPRHNAIRDIARTSSGLRAGVVVSANCTPKEISATHVFENGELRLDVRQIVGSVRALCNCPYYIDYELDKAERKDLSIRLFVEGKERDFATLRADNSVSDSCDSSPDYSCYAGPPLKCPKVSRAQDRSASYPGERPSDNKVRFIFTDPEMEATAVTTNFITAFKRSRWYEEPWRTYEFALEKRPGTNPKYFTLIVKRSDTNGKTTEPVDLSRGENAQWTMRVVVGQSSEDEEIAEKLARKLGARPFFASRRDGSFFRIAETVVRFTEGYKTDKVRQEIRMLLLMNKPEQIVFTSYVPAGTKVTWTELEILVALAKKAYDAISAKKFDSVSTATIDVGKKEVSLTACTLAKPTDSEAWSVIHNRRVFNPGGISKRVSIRLD